jgi:hypothetical protein
MDNCESITRWRTIQRPSASAAKPTVRGLGGSSHFRAVDQAILCPGVSGHIKTLDKFHEGDDTTIKLDAERIHYEMLRRPVSFLLDNGSGYGNARDD